MRQFSRRSSGVLHRQLYSCVLHRQLYSCVLYRQLYSCVLNRQLYNCVLHRQLYNCVYFVRVSVVVGLTASSWFYEDHFLY